MLNFYIHQIGDIRKYKTYKRFIRILESKMICSRGYLENQGIEFEYDNPSFVSKKLDENNNDIHKDRVSLSNPDNEFVALAILNKDHRSFTCFDYDYIAFAISKDVPIVPKEETKNLALGEVQVEDKIDSKYIIGLILPINGELKGTNLEIANILSNICENNDFPLDIYNYDGELIKEKNKTKKKILN